MVRHPIIVLVAAAMLGGCPSSQEIRTAKTSAYDADFAIVYGEVVEATRALYPELDEDPTTGIIRTAWHQVSYTAAGQDAKGGGDPRTTGGTTGPLGTPAASLATRYFIRFDLVVAGGRPWQVRVTAHAQEYRAGDAEAVDLKGANTPHWLAGRRDGLILSIYKRLKKYAVHIQEAAPVEEPVEVVDVKTFGDIPEDAAAAAAAIVLAIDTRDFRGLRANLADDVVWSFGAEGDADTALAMWQADPETLATLGKVLRAGCHVADDVVTCPLEATDSPGYLGWRATLEQRGGAWKLTSFVQGD